MRRHVPAPTADDAGTPLGLAALLAGTLVGTVGNSVVNVPLDAILDDFDAPLGSGVFVVVGFLLTFAATMPLAGWVGDRFGRRRTYCAALLGTAVCAIGVGNRHLASDPDRVAVAGRRGGGRIRTRGDGPDQLDVHRGSDAPARSGHGRR